MTRPDAVLLMAILMASTGIVSGLTIKRMRDMESAKDEKLCSLFCDRREQKSKVFYGDCHCLDEGNYWVSQGTVTQIFDPKWTDINNPHFMEGYK